MAILSKILGSTANRLVSLALCWCDVNNQEMFIRQFSVRWLLLITAGCAVVSMVIALAVAGQLWATCVVGGLLSMIAVAIVHALLFGLLQIASAMLARRQLNSPPED